MARIDTEKCLGCGGCIDLCPAIAISMINDVVLIDEKPGRSAKDGGLVEYRVRRRAFSDHRP
ncbi:MAG: 4Fe-4S dicluster domain-containing protein [Thermodesulfobacteriota bacterium]